MKAELIKSHAAYNIVGVNIRKGTCRQYSWQLKLLYLEKDGKIPSLNG
jgi:hypothetical protein